MSNDEYTCIKCGRHDCDAFTEVIWNDLAKCYSGYCRHCVRSDARLVQVIQLTIRLHLERAYARIPKKRKPVTP
jgi:hypothetical protein